MVHALAERVAKGELDATTVDDLMPYVDEVWDRMEFRTPWSREREREAVQDVLSRFLAWHHRPGARTDVRTEQELRADVTLPDGQAVVLRGFADRLELDEHGGVVVVDLKTGKYPPSDKSLPENAQLGLYQLAVDNGAADELFGRPVSAGGAELIQLRHGDTQPKVQAQPPSPPQIEAQLQKAVAAVRREAFVARPGQHCDRCEFQRDLSRLRVRVGALVNVDTPEQLAGLMGHDWLYSEEQFAAITADLEPAVVVAGAGSGKTAVMAARVVWLVATGQVAPGEVLGLTFTTKATAELQTSDPRQPAPRRTAARARAAAGRPGRPEAEEERGGADGRDLSRLRGGTAVRARPPDRSRA